MDKRASTIDYKPITNSIMLTVKKMLGIAEEYHAFDLDIIMNINAVFLTLNQLGVGPKKPFSISGPESTWNDFLGSQMDILQGVQTYIYMRVRLMFDPPTNSFLVDSMQKQIAEFEWRFNVQSETPPKDETEEDQNRTEDLVTEVLRPAFTSTLNLSIVENSSGSSDYQELKDIFR